ncbi:MAG: ABC-2 type transport system ATP-binding protein [Halobacteriales archaeon]|jgi:ABC-2 type transport system ATP-binding protein
MSTVTAESSAPLAVEGVSVSYGDVQALSTVTLHLDPGFTALLGPNGAGKTTLFRVSAGVLPPDSGTVRIAGRDPFTDPESKADVGYLSHGPALDGRRSVRENLHFWGRAYGMAEGERADRIETIADRFAFADLLDRDGDALSRGQRQRVGLGRALLHDPSVVFLDEPTAGLDPTTSRSLQDELDAVAEDRTLLYATHNLHEAADLADYIAFLRDGELVAHGAVDTLLASTQLGGGRQVAVDAGEDAREPLDDLGYDPTREDGEWLVTLSDGEEPADLVGNLVERGVRVSGAETVEADLDDLYRHLEGRA